MRAPFVAAIALSFAVASSSGQAPITKLETSSSCSVGINARPQGAGVTMWTTSMEEKALPGSAAEPKSGVHVVVKALEARQTIRELTLRVTYLPPGLRVIPTDSFANGEDHVVKGRRAQEQSRTFQLSAENGAALRLTGDLLLGRVSGVQRVAVEHIEFADGTAWSAPKKNPCSVTPDGFVPVDAQAH